MVTLTSVKLSLIVHRRGLQIQNFFRVANDALIPALDLPYASSALVLSPMIPWGAEREREQGGLGGAGGNGGEPAHLITYR